MKAAPSLKLAALCAVAVVIAMSTANACAQTCQTSTDLDDATRTSVTTAGQRFFTWTSGGDVASLKQNAIASLASDFGGVENTIKAHQPEMTGAQPVLKGLFLLDEQGLAPDPHAEFYCGVFGKNGQTANSAAFYLDNLPPGKYGIVLFQATTAKAVTNVSLILQAAGTDWKLGGLYIKPAQRAGHDSEWFLTQARAYKGKGQTHNAWLFCQEARNLISPLPFMGTLTTDRLFDECQSMQPTDFPVNGKNTDMALAGATYKINSVFLTVIGADMDVGVWYQVPDLSNTNLTYSSNMAVIRGLVTKYPELRDAFAGVEARALDPNGRDYGTLLAMKDVK